jgi:hypothetical protein
VAIPKVYNGHNRTFFFAAVESRYRTDHVQVDDLMANDAARGDDFSNTVLATNVDAAPVPVSIASQFPTVKTNTSVLYRAFSPIGTQLAQLTAPTNGTLLPFPNNVIPRSLLDPVTLKLYLRQVDRRCE